MKYPPHRNTPRKMRGWPIAIFGMAFLALGSDSLYAQTDVYLRLYTKTFQRMEIDLYAFEPAEGSLAPANAVARVEEVLSNDLWMSGYFRVNIKSGSPPAEAVAKPASSNGGGKAIAWLGGTFRFSNNNVSFQPMLVDLASGRAIIRARYADRVENQRGLLHQISDDIVYNLTGERGIAQSRIAFVSQGRDGIKEISVMDYDGYNERPLTSDKSINLSPAWSPDGAKICYTSFQKGNPNIYMTNLQTSTKLKLSDFSGLNSAPAWSPDGRRLALTLSKDGNAELYVYETRSKKYRRLTYNRAIDSSPTWSPANREIAFTSDRSGSPQIYIMDSDGLGVRRLTYQGQYNDSPTWSPRGDKIAYVSRTASGFDVYTMDVTGDNTMRLTDSSGSNEDPSWSPNGFSLVFSSTRTGRKELFSMFWDGSDQKRVSAGGIKYLPAWSPRLN